VFSRNEYELVGTKMEKAAIAKESNAEIFAYPQAEADTKHRNRNLDVLLLDPKFRLMKGSLSEKKLAAKIFR